MRGERKVGQKGRQAGTHARTQSCVKAHVCCRALLSLLPLRPHVAVVVAAASPAPRGCVSPNVTGRRTSRSVAHHVHSLSNATRKTQRSRGWGRHGRRAPDLRLTPAAACLSLQRRAGRGWAARSSALRPCTALRCASLQAQTTSSSSWEGGNCPAAAQPGCSSRRRATPTA